MLSEKSSESKKYVRGFLLLTVFLEVYLLNRFFVQLSDWFDLEAKVENYNLICQIVSLVCGIGTFIYALRDKFITSYLSEVISELEKVVWANRSETLKLTFGIMLGLVVTSILLGLVDFGIGKLLGLLY